MKQPGPDYEAMAGLTAGQRQRLEMERLAGRGRKTYQELEDELLGSLWKDKQVKEISLIPKTQVGLTRDQLNQVMLELQKHGTDIYDPWESHEIAEFHGICYAGRILAKACGIEV